MHFTTKNFLGQYINKATNTTALLYKGIKKDSNQERYYTFSSGVGFLSLSDDEFNRNWKPHDPYSNLPKQQKYPSSVIKEGAVLYRYDAIAYDDGTYEVECQEWIVRSIRRKRGSKTVMGGRKSFLADFASSDIKYVNMTQKKKGVTWGKLSKKHFDFGFLKSIPQAYKQQFAVGSDLPKGFYTTKLAALKYELKHNEISLKESQRYLKIETDPDCIAEHEEEIRDYTKCIQLLKSRLTRMNNEKRKAILK
ncbi:hypothetical protein [Vibrio parahaemolyticus]|uniref:hypothetical protein n=1 Tax=Vibrio parahaemolyticus TaxID=670 RepID=UPI00193C8CBB|nr:hypothetical protein [Vibrio parahaemolyticus]EHA1078728.1 hypothetical protein [Vibrio alginolyticus]EGQ8547939.1 hypothetical protein [Vibrio parahaemolyticus]EGR3042471.1 hypothetical protein [Vibrio parahaemolyticus]EHA1137168.1 hypothetical protein [Vibrio alginolyticus]